MRVVISAAVGVRIRCLRSRTADISPILCVQQRRLCSSTSRIKLELSVLGGFWCMHGGGVDRFGVQFDVRGDSK